MTGPLERRAADLARLADERWDLLIVGGGIVGAGALLDAVSPRPEGRARRAGRHRRRHQLPLQPPDPRRAALPPAGRGRPRPRGARRARPAPAPGATPRPPGGVPVPDLRAAVRQARVLRGRPHGLRHPGLDRVGRPPPPPRARRDPGLRPEPRAPGPARRAALPRRDGGRRAVHARGRAHGHRPRARASAVAVTRVRATGPLRDGDRVTGATVADLLDRGHRRGPRIGRARCDRCLGRAARIARSGPAPSTCCPPGAATSSSSASRIPARGGMTLRIPGRVAFLVPWPRHWIIGTTDKPVPRAAGPRRRQRRGGGRDPRDAEWRARPRPSPATTSSAPTLGCGRWSRRRTRRRPSRSPASTGWPSRRRASCG